MATEQIITIVGLNILGILLLFFLTPKFIFLCDSFGEFIADFIEGLIDAFIDTVEEWKYIFKRWTK